MTDHEKSAREAIRRRDFAGLSVVVEAAREAGQLTPQLELWGANLARERGDLEEARGAYARVLEHLPNQVAAWFNYGLTCEALELFDEAAQGFGRSLSRPGGHRPSLFRLGECLTRLGRPDAARQLYERGVEEGLLKDPMQRPAHHFDGLRATPVWSAADLPGLDALNRADVRRELLSLLHDGRSARMRGEWNSPALRHGQWDKLFLGHRGALNPEMDAICPRTMEALRNVPMAAGLPEGNICLSILRPNTEIRAHCGPTNIRLRAHLGLEIPPGCGIRIAGKQYAWQEGQWLVFDDSFEHEAWNRSSQERVVLILDLWHPDLSTPAARRAALPTTHLR